MLNDTEIDEILGDGPQTEEDEPFVLFESEDNRDDNRGANDLARIKLRNAEKEKERKERRYFTAFRLIVGCLVFLGIIYLIDVISNAVLHKEVSQITNSIVEIIKTLLFTLSGYLFARKENGD